MNTDQSNTSLRISDWWVHPALSEIHKNEKVVQLEPKVMDLLVQLASRPGEVFSRQELEETIWQGTVVGYDALSKAVTKLREALGDDKKNPRYIQTISKKGYRLIAQVSQETQPGPATPDASPANTSYTHKLSSTSRAMWFSASVVVLLLALLVYLFSQSQQDTADRKPPMANNLLHSQDSKPVIVVLPFRNTSPAEKDSYLADGITSDLITSLSRLSALWVTAINTVQLYKDMEISAEEAKQEFNANYLLSGDVSKIDDAIKINVHLSNVKTGKVLWAERYNRKFTDFFALQDEVTRKIVENLKITVTNEEKQRIANRYTNNLQAYETFLKAQYLVNARTAAENSQARELYNKAIELDPGFARAYAGLAMSYTVSYIRHWPVDIENPLQNILSLSNRAIELDKNLPESYWVAGYVHANRKKPEKAKEFLNQALILNPNYADAYAMLGSVHISTGELETALQHMATATRLNPNGGHLYLLQFGRAYYFLSEYKKALHYLNLTRDRNPNNIDALLYLIATYASLEKFDEAHWIYLEARNVNPDLDIQTWIQRIAIIDSRFRAKLTNDLKNAEKSFQEIKPSQQ